jgi:hypothetical protein
MDSENTQNNENFGTQPPQPPNDMRNPYMMSKEQFGDMVYTMSRDMKFLGIMSIIYGIINCLTILGAVIGVPYIFAGIRLKESGESFGFYSKNYDEMALQQAIERQKRFFFIMKVLVIIGIVVFALIVLFYILMFAFFFSNMGGIDEIFREFQ